jgi:PAS domain S-box-containing protein
MSQDTKRSPHKRSLKTGARAKKDPPISPAPTQATTSFNDLSAQQTASQVFTTLITHAKVDRQRLLGVMELLPIGLAILDAKGGNIQANRAYQQIWGSPLPVVNGVNGYTAYKAWWVDTNQPIKPEEWAAAQAVQQGIIVSNQLLRIQRIDGSFAYVLNSAAPIFDHSGQVDGCVVAIQNVSDLKRREDEIQQLNRTLRALSNSNQALLHATSEVQFLTKVCQIIIEDCGYKMVWIGYLEDDEQQSVKPVASAGFDQGYLDALKISLKDPVRGRGPTGTAIRTRSPTCCNNMLTDPCFSPWRQAAIEHGYASSLVVPLLEGDQAIGAINIYAHEPDGFPEAEQKLLIELAGDLAFGIATLRLKAESARYTDALRRSETHYRSLFDNMTEGFALHELIYDHQGTPKDYRFLEINPAFEQLTGLTHAQTIGRLASQVMPQLDSSWVDTYAKVVLTGQPAQFERHVEALGRYLRIYAYRPAPGQFATILMDVTEARDATLKLDLTSEKYASLFNTTSDGISIGDLDGTILEANDAFCAMSGYSPHELIGKPVSMLEANENPAEVLGHIQSIVQHGGHDIFETRHRRKDGSLIDVDITALYLPGEGGRIAIFARNITERKAAEVERERLAGEVQMERDRLSALVANIQDEVWFADTHKRFTLANPAALKEFSLVNNEAVEVESLAANLEVLRPDGSPRPIDDAPPLRALKGETVSNQEEIVRTPVSGELRYRQVSASPVRDQSGQIIGSVSVVHDITDRKLAEQAIRQARDELELRVQERTQELNLANDQLRAEVAEREKAQLELESSVQELQVIEEELRNNNEMLIDAQKVLADERQRYQDLFEFAPDAYLVSDRFGHILEANHFTSRLLNIQHDHLIGKPLVVYVALQDHRAFNKLLARLKNEPDIQVQELCMLPRDGPEIVVSIKVARAEEQRKGYSLRWTIRDISYRKQAEETIRQNSQRNAVLSEVSHALANASLDEKAIVDIVAKTTANLVGDGCIITLVSADGNWLEPAAFSHNKAKVHDIMSSLYGASHNLVSVGLFGSVFQSGEPLLIKQLSPADALASVPSLYHHYLDSVGITSLLVVPIKVPDQVIGTLGILRDRNSIPYNEDDQSMLERIAARTGQAIHNARLYQELQTALRKELETHDQLVQAEKFAAVGRLLASITHEINNPLQTIKNCLYLSQMDAQPGTPLHDSLNIAVAETNRLSNLVAQLREIYRPPTQGRRKPLSLPTLVDEVQVLLASYLQDKHVKWQVTPPQDESFTQMKVDGVPDQLKQVFLNICLNAIDAMEPKGGTLEIDFITDTEAEQMGVSFRDSGPGLPPEVKAKLFEPFTTTKEKGLGLGLVICYDIIQKHNGHIDVESEAGKGASFTIWLPARKA